MWNNRHPSDGGDDPEGRRNEQNQGVANDPARLAAVSALAAFSQGSYGGANQLPATYAGSAGAGAFRQGDALSYQEQALRQQQAMLAFQQHQHALHPQPQQQFSLEEMEYARQLQARREAEQQLQRLQGQQQFWDPSSTQGNRPFETTVAARPFGVQRQSSSSGSHHSNPSFEIQMQGLSAGAAAQHPVRPFEMQGSSDREGDAIDPSGRSKKGTETEQKPSGPDSETASLVPRGKPEAMAARLAASRIEAERQELEAEAQRQQETEAEAIAEPVADDSGGVLAAVAKPVSKKPKKSVPKRSKKKSPPASADRAEFLLNERVPSITDDEYENLEALMTQFCRVPLLAEFSRPVTLLHPELVAGYSKIVSHPVDLGHVCRGIRRRQYKNTRDIRLDMWRVFANCVKFHSHPNNKEAVPSFVSIALHLREYFNNLWQEFMLPSDLPEDASEIQKKAFAKRTEERKKRVENSGVLVLGKNFIRKIATSMGGFIDAGGCVDELDKEPIFGPNAAEYDKDLDTVIYNLREHQNRLAELSESEDDYTLEEFAHDIKKCYTEDVLEENPSLRIRVGNRVDRFVGKIAVPLHEANSRGVTQSSVWGNIATTIWARESSKKPFWPALCLGILPPEDQREGWHSAVTERNEARLPEKLRTQLMAAKRKCEQAQKRQSLSYFLVEFLGTHEFIWVRETDIIEKFDVGEDPNVLRATSKKKRASRSGVASVIGSKTYATALEECKWATEEFDTVLQDAFDYSEDEAWDDGEMNYSYSLLAQSDDEADEEDEHGFGYDEDAMSMTDVDEANWLLSHEGMIDTSSAGRKNAKRRALALKKKAEKKDATDASRKSKGERSKRKQSTRAKEREEKREQRDLEKRRKKRLREREKSLREQARKQKKRRTLSYDSDEDDRGLGRDKRARATAIVNAYLTRMAEKDDYKSLALSGVMTIPAAMIDSTGLIGMALAFRAAAGELTMPDDSGEQEKKLKPWTAIDAEGPKTSAEREANLEKQIELLEKEIQRVKANTERRIKLADDAVAKRKAIEMGIEADEEAARQNHFKKKKKASPKPSDGAHDHSSSGKEKAETAEEQSVPDPSAEKEAEAVQEVTIEDDAEPSSPPEQKASEVLSAAPASGTMEVDEVAAEAVPANNAMAETAAIADE